MIGIKLQYMVLFDYITSLLATGQSKFSSSLAKRRNNDDDWCLVIKLSNHNSHFQVYLDLLVAHKINFKDQMPLLVIVYIPNIAQ